MEYKETRSVVEAGFLTSIVIVLGIVANSVPLLTFLGTLIAPMTLAILTIRHNIKWGILGLVTSFVVFTAFLGPIQAVLESTFGIIGVVIGYGYRKDWRASQLLILSSVVAYGLFIATILLTAFTSHIDLATLWENTKTTALANSMATYEQQGFTEEQLEQIRSLITEQLEYLKNIFLIAGYFSALGFVFLVGKLTEFVSRRTGKPVGQPLPPVSEWRMPKWSVYVLVAGLLAAYWGSTRNIDILYWSGRNFEYFGAILVTIQGISFLWFLGKKYGISTFVKWVAFFFILVMPSLGIVMGIFDLFTSYRDRINQSK